MGRPQRNAEGLTEAQVRKIESKRQYDAEHYRRMSNRSRWGSPEHKAIVTKKGLAKRKAPGHAATTRLMEMYKWNAKVKGVPFELTREQFSAIIAMNCHYCGAAPSMTKVGKDIWSPLTYNGIDRVQNARGYMTDNAVPCCRICNIAKRDLSANEFLEWVFRVYRHQQEIRR